MKTPLMMIINPAAGKGGFKRSLPDALRLLSDTGYAVSLFFTECRGHATELATQYAGAFPYLLVLGGDGTLAGARILDESNVNTDKIQILSRVKLMNHSTNKEVEYTIVSEKEANLKAGKLSIGTPIAQALLGKKKGDKVDVQVPAGTVCFEVLDISI